MMAKSPSSSSQMSGQFSSAGVFCPLAWGSGPILRKKFMGVRIELIQRDANCSHFGCKGFCWQNASVTKTLHSKLSKLFCEHIRSLRDAAGMTQRDLAEALGREHGMVGRIELGERRVDFVEAFAVFQALGADPVQEASALMAKFKQQI
ncbi:MAG: helix-turn-helix domain-containing protein [Roseimicrobium sp.]